jgi:hypothetical protein
LRSLRQISTGRAVPTCRRRQMPDARFSEMVKIIFLCFFCKMGRCLRSSEHAMKFSR